MLSIIDYDTLNTISRFTQRTALGSDLSSKESDDYNHLAKFDEDDDDTVSVQDEDDNQILAGSVAGYEAGVTSMTGKASR